MGIEKHARLTEDAVAHILEEAVDSSYRKGGEHASITEDIVKPRTNTIMPKIIYVYEGINTENKHHELINKKHFSGVYEGGKEVEKLWNEVWEYIEASYDTEELIKYISTEMVLHG